MVVGLPVRKKGNYAMKMRKINMLSIAGCLLIFSSVFLGGLTVFCPSASPQCRDTLDRFVREYSDAYCRGSESELLKLAERHRDLLRAAVDRLLLEYVRDQRQADSIMRRASSLAECARQLSGDDYLIRHVEKNRAWSADQNALKLRGNAYLTRGGTAFGEGEYKDALLLTSKALEVFRLIGDTHGEMQALHYAGHAARKLTRYADALAYHQKALRLGEKSGDRLQKGVALIDMGDVYERKKNHSRAIEMYGEALKVFKVPEDWREATRALRQLGDVYVEGGRFEQAFRSYGQALKYAEEAGDAEAEARQRDYMGYFYRRLGDYDRAVEFHGRALAAAKKIPDPISKLRARARAYNHMGLSVAAMTDTWRIRNNAGPALDNLREAIEYEERALRAASESKDAWRQGYVIRALAYFHRQASLLKQGEEKREALRRSLKYAEDALRRARKMGEKEWEGMALHHLALAHAALGRSLKAEQSFESALTIWNGIGDLRSRGFAYRFMAQALYEPELEFKKALAAYDKALAAFQPIQAFEQIADVYLRKGLVYEQLEENLRAKEAYLSSIQTLEGIRDKLSVEEHKVAFFERRQDPYEALINLLIKLYRRDSRLGHALLALEISERARGRAILDMIKEVSGKIQAGVDRDILSREQEIHAGIYRTRRSLIAERDPVKALALKERLNQLNLEYAHLIQELEEAYPKYARLKNPRPLSLKDIQDRVLKPGEFLLEYFVGQSSTYLFVISRRNLEAVLTLPVGKEELTREIEALREPFKKAKTGWNIKTLGSFDLNLAHVLYNQLFRQVEPFISKATHLVIVPHGPLFYLPFEMLATSKIGARTQDRADRFAKARYLVETAPPISYAISASVMDPKLRRIHAAGRHGHLLAFGNPMGPGVADKKRGMHLSGREMKVSSLPYAEQEVLKVASLYAPNAKAYLGDNATKTLFVKESSFYSHLLLSTHGIMDEEHPMFSSLVFAACPDTGEFELLQAHEVFNLSLKAKLTTLSACEVGLGEIRDGEGVIGLSRAFIYAGVEKLVVSMWSVDDQATALLITDFHRLVRQNDGQVARALMKSKLKLLSAGRKGSQSRTPYSHPYFWAPFILMEGSRRP